MKKSEWNVKEALDLANTLANHGWGNCNPDTASSCIYALCRKLKEEETTLAAMGKAMDAIANIAEWMRTSGCERASRYANNELDAICAALATENKEDGDAQ